MADPLTTIASVVAGIGSLICFILVAFVKGWMDGLGTVMWVWTACIVVGLLSNFVF